MDSSHSGGDPAPGLLSCPTQLIFIQRKKYFTILIFITNIISIKVTKVQLLSAMVRTLRSPPAPWRKLFETLENKLSLTFQRCFCPASVCLTNDLTHRHRHRHRRKPSYISTHQIILKLPYHSPCYCQLHHHSVWRLHFCKKRKR